jgi:predicted RNase H-like HicB family nuclease
MDAILERLDRIERMLTLLLQALVDEEEPQPMPNLDGEPAPLERDQLQPLG